MIVFELTMPNVGSWNGHWSGENDKHIIVKDERYLRPKQKENLPKILEQENFWYRWDDGWTACISVSKMFAKDANKLKKQSRGFYGYDWMVESILKNGEIIVEGK